MVSTPHLGCGRAVRVRHLLPTQTIGKRVIELLVEEAAKHLEMNPQTLRLALQQGLFPFGVAVKTSPNRYTYKIFPNRLTKYLEGMDYEKANTRGCDHNRHPIGNITTTTNKYH